MPGSVLDRLSRDDAQILRLGRGVIRGHTCKVIVLECSNRIALPTVEQLRAQIYARLDRAPRFRQRIVGTPLRVANPVWLDDPEFDIGRHVTALPTPSPPDRQELEQLVASRMETALDQSRPLWHLDVVERLEDGAMALIWRVHHCLADGTTCVRLASAILWDVDEQPSLPAPTTWRPEVPPRPITLLGRGLSDRARTSAQHLRVRSGRLPSIGRAEAVINRELWPVADRTPLATRVGSARAVAFCDAPLERCRRAGKAIDDSVTVNDVILSIVAGGVREWLARGTRGGRVVRVKVPVSLHHAGEGENVGNRDSFFFVELPVDEVDPLRRVLAVSRETRTRKLAHDAETLYRLGTHPFVNRWTMSPRVFTFNVSNVPGPRSEVYVLGARVRELYSLAEIAQHHALRIAVISAAGALHFGLCADRAAVQDLDVLAGGLRRSADELLDARI